MFTQFKAKFAGNSFLSSAIILFVANIIVAAFNYSIVILASRVLGENYSLWTALNGVITILMTINIGIYTNIIRTVASLHKEGKTHEILNYYTWYRRNLTKVVVIGLLFSPVFAFAISTIVVGTSLLVAELLTVFVFVNILLGVQQNFLIGTLQNLPFAFGMIGANFVRLLATYLLLTTQKEITALPLGLIASTVVIELIAGYFWSRKAAKLKLEPTDSDEIIRPVNLRLEIRHSVITILSMVSLSALLNINPILMQNSPITNSSKDFFAVLFNFGQIIHFASIAGLGGLVAYSSQSSNKKIYITAVAIASGVTAFVGAGFFFAGPLILNIFGRVQYVSELNLILLYALFVGFYNIIYISTQYLLAKGKQVQIYILIMGVGALVLTNSMIPRSPVDSMSNQVIPNINVSIAISFVIAALLVIKVCFSKFKK